MTHAGPLKRVFADLKRRNVFRVAAVYGGGGFVLLQVAELLAEGLSLPPAVLRIATFTEELLNTLAKNRLLRVVGRTYPSHTRDRTAT